MESLKQYLSDTSKRFNRMPLLLREYVDGVDIDFNGFAVDGALAAWSVQRSIVHRNVVGKSIRWLKFDGHESVLALGRRIVQTSRYNGPLHIDMRLCRKTGRLYTIETNTRFWNSIYASILDGINFADVAVQTTFHPDKVWSPQCSGAIWGGVRMALTRWLRTKSRSAFDELSCHRFKQLRHAYQKRKADARIASTRTYDRSFQEELTDI